MGNVWIMGLYDLKEFLTFEDVADYLRDKGVYDFDVSGYQGRSRLYSLLYELVASEKITPVFRYNGLLKTSIFKHEEEIILENKVFLFSDTMIEVWKNTDYFPHFEVSSEGRFPCLYQEFVTCTHFYILEDKNPQYGNEPLFPKSQLENIFLQTQKDNLQPQINDIDRQLQDELTPKTQKAITKLLYALLVEHGYELGAKKGNTNDILQSLTKKHGVELSREFIATQLDKVNKLEKT